MSRILLLEDDLSLINGLSYAFGKQGFELDIARTLKEGEMRWTDGKYDLLVLDVSLPDGSGFDFCKKVRLTSNVPVIFLTASDEETSIIMGLDIGGDDYIAKPFKLGVLISRINALLRRANSFQAEDTELRSNGVSVLLLQGRAFKNGEPLELTAALASGDPPVCFACGRRSLYRPGEAHPQYAGHCCDKRAVSSAVY